MEFHGASMELHGASIEFHGVILHGGYTPTIPIRVCAAQRGRDFGTSDLERGNHFRDVS